MAWLLDRVVVLLARLLDRVVVLLARLLDLLPLQSVNCMWKKCREEGWQGK